MEYSLEKKAAKKKTNLISKTISDLKQYKEFIFYNSKYELKVQVANTLLGYVWWLLDPLFHMLVYTIMVTFIFNGRMEGFAVFVFCALLPWKWYTSTIMNSANCVKAKLGILNQTYIPKFVLPLTQIIVNFTKFIFGLIILFPMIFIFDLKLSFHFFEIIIVIFVNALFLYGCSLLIAHYGVFFKDIKNVLTHVVRLWFYLSPGLYSLDQVPESVRFLWWLNPNTTLFESYRNVIMFESPPLYLPLAILGIISLGLIYLGLSKLNKYDKAYLKMS
ncbi:ABC transporter permease [Cytobacillus firmus]|uniref:ABC transporter permease n=1 Tax=Cytobacillus firmus TaxID=1399 RepID=UPI0021636C28|nr:ABC transporter permease [Cytobacillus firmus]MCS0654758.1 ABC transporter permease [Cytobacillus firmus]MCU1807079.1 ABC transporter permease [Cytobacillus firmus]